MEEDLTGIELARLFYWEAVAPIVDRVFPGLPYTAGLLGDCSDVIGLDDAISRDHGWGPRCQLLLPPAGFADTRRALHVALADGLPPRFRGYSTSFGDASQGWRRVDVDGPPVKHWVDMATPERFLEAELGITAATRLTARDWLAMRSDKLLGVTAGALFRDDLRFDHTRRALAFYPEDVRLYLIAAEWMKIADEQAFPGRAGSCGDDVGSAIIAARLAEGLMRLCFHLERKYAPYSKWFGSAFARLPGCAGVRGPMASMLTAAGWKDRDRHWTDALIAVIGLHEREGLLDAGKYRPAPVYLGRPGTGLPQFAPDPPSIASLIDDIRDRIADRDVSALAAALEPA